MALAPTFISRSILVLKVKKNKSLVSTTFLARFEDGKCKLLNDTKWQDNGLLREVDLFETPMSKDNCSLFFKDWSKSPIRGTFKDNYPEALIPEEITSLM